MAAASQSKSDSSPEVLISAADYCSIKSLTKLDTLIFLKAMFGTDRFTRRSVSDWDEKYTEFYSRKS